MADEFGIKVICCDPTCGKSFPISTGEGEEKKEISFAGVAQAFEYRSKLLASATDESYQYHECTECHAFTPHASVKEYIVARLDEGGSRVLLVVSPWDDM